MNILVSFVKVDLLGKGGPLKAFWSYAPWVKAVALRPLEHTPLGEGRALRATWSYISWAKAEPLRPLKHMPLGEKWTP